MEVVMKKEDPDRIKIIKKADEICDFARKLYDSKRSSTLRKAASLYEKATLSYLSKKINKEADEWDKFIDSWWQI